MITFTFTDKCKENKKKRTVLCNKLRRRVLRSK
jgi:hypothetical protein